MHIAYFQNWGLGGTPAGTPYEGQVAVLVSISVLFIIGMLYRRRGETFAPEFQAGLD